MTKQLNEIVREEVEKTKKELASLYYGRNVMFHGETHKEISKILISSQISLLEAELERKKGLFKELLSYESDERGWNECLRNDIIYLTEQIEECRKLLTK